MSASRKSRTSKASPGSRGEARSTRPELLAKAWEYPFFEALYGRRSRRFGLGFEIPEGPFRYKSRHAPLPLSELEEALLVAAGVGVTGAPLWDMSRPVAFRGGPGRTYATTSRGLRTALFYSNDEGVWFIDPAGTAATQVREVKSAKDRERMLRIFYERRRNLRRGRLGISRRVPPLFAHNHWASDMAGATLFMPVVDVSASMIALLAQLVDGRLGRFVRGHRGGAYVVDDRCGFRPAGTEKRARSGFLDREKPLPLSVLERQACYYMFSEPATICHNISLAAETIGLGAWMHCGFLSAEVLKALGFTMVESAMGPSYPSPVGLKGSFEGFCPPFFASMDAAVDAALSRVSREGAGADAAKSFQGVAPYRMSDQDYYAQTVELSDEGLACIKSICNYVYDTYGRFPGNIDPMHLMWFVQVVHLDLDFYERFFHEDACGPAHRVHLETWHG